MPHSNSPWTPEDDEILRDMWAKKILVREIAAKLNRTRSAVVGRAHRLLLEKRENPIKNRKYYVPKPKLTAPKSQLIRKPPKRVDHPWMKSTGDERKPEPSIPEDHHVEAPVTGIGGQRFRCQFISGTPNGVLTLYCGQPSMAGKSYCPRCYQICYLPPKPYTIKPKDFYK